MGSGVGIVTGGEIDGWLRSGGLVVAASERSARALAAAYDRTRLAEGLKAWAAAQIQHWQSFVRLRWAECSGDDRMVMSGFQEQSLWAEIVGAEGRGTGLLEGPRRQVAVLAMDAHRLLCSYAPRFLPRSARRTWQQDAGAFSSWLSAFDQACDASGLISEARLPLELIQILETDSASRPPLLLAGFDRIPPVQRRVLDAWGKWHETSPGCAAKIQFHVAVDSAAELAACANWCKKQLDRNPGARLLVVTGDLALRRGEFERAFLRFTGSGSASNLFEFSLGVPLRLMAPARGAFLLLRWLSEAVEEHELDWLFSTGQAAADSAEERALVGTMRALRRRGMERMRWTLLDFIGQRSDAALPDGWIARMTLAKRRLDESVRRSPADPPSWAELALRLLKTMGWPGWRAPSSAEFQVLRRWQQSLDACASLGFNGQRMSWDEFLSALRHALDETLFAPESRDAPIQIAGPAESAGLTADAIWMMGASEEKWPAGGQTNPLLPFDLQREAAMPHATPQLDWKLAQTMTARLQASAGEVHFSFAQQVEGVATRPSKLIAVSPQPIPAELAAPAPPEPLTERFEDSSRVPLPSSEVVGGSSILTLQSQCPFKAFATARLNAQGWERAQTGLTASQRGQLLHAVLHSVWAGKPTGIRTHKELMEIADLATFVEGHVRGALRAKTFATATERMPQRYMELERMRLVALVTEWLQYERTRADFSVARTELDTDASVAGLSLNLRIDRIDRLNDGSLLVIDYKSGNVSPALWELPRPEDVQVPLYAGFGLGEELRDAIAKDFDNGPEADEGTAGRIGGLVFARVRPSEVCFAGRVGNAQATLLPGLANRTALVQRPLNAEDLIEWRDYIEQMARDFIDGRADVDPREYPATCRQCDLQSLCRIAENQLEPREEEDEDE